jgi:hypothetical protein
MLTLVTDDMGRGFAAFGNDLMDIKYLPGGLACKYNKQRMALPNVDYFRCCRQWQK